MSNSDEEECGDDDWVDIALLHDCVDVACQIVPDCARQPASQVGSSKKHSTDGTDRADRVVLDVP